MAFVGWQRFVAVALEASSHNHVDSLVAAVGTREVADIVVRMVEVVAFERYYPHHSIPPSAAVVVAHTVAVVGMDLDVFLHGSFFLVACIRCFELVHVGYYIHLDCHLHHAMMSLMIYHHNFLAIEGVPIVYGMAAYICIIMDLYIYHNLV